MMSSARFLIPGIDASMRRSDIASSTRSAGFLNGWPAALWQSAHSIRCFGSWSISAFDSLLVASRYSVALPSLPVIRTQGIVRFCTSSVTYSTFCSMCQWMPRVAFSRASPPPVCMTSFVRVSVFFSSGS